MADSEHLVAAVGDAQGTEYISAPESYSSVLDRDLAQRFHRAGSEFGQLFCPVNLGGCGGLLNYRSGPVQRPHFAHRSVPCGVDPEHIWTRFMHRQIQEDIATWLRGAGYCVALEAAVGPHERVDVLVKKEGRPRRVIEVQLSPQRSEITSSRTDRYGGAVDWLFDLDRCAGSVEQEVRDQGYVLGVRWTAECGTQVAAVVADPPLRLDKYGLSDDELSSRPRTTEWLPVNSAGFSLARGFLLPGTLEAHGEIEARLWNALDKLYGRVGAVEKERDAALSQRKSSSELRHEIHVRDSIIDDLTEEREKALRENMVLRETLRAVRAVQEGGLL